MRTFGSFPTAGSNENLAVALAFLAIEFVNRHGERIARKCQSPIGKVKTVSPVPFWAAYAFAHPCFMLVHRAKGASTSERRRLSLLTPPHPSFWRSRDRLLRP